jgi:PTS system ascorbate-specific IIB component
MPIRIATLCRMGFGSSMMLKMFIEEILKDLGMKAEVIPWDLGTFKG